MVPLYNLFVLLASPMIGSFAETLYRRSSISRPALLQRSECSACHTKIGVLTLIPIFGFLIARGKCSACSVPISRYYFFTEAAFFIVTFWALYTVPNSNTFATVGLGWLLVMLARIDFEKLILPDILSFGVALLGLATIPFHQSAILFDRIAGLVFGFALLWLVNWVYIRVRGFSGLGRGDAKLFGALGIWTGLSGLASVLLLAALFALIAALLSARVTRRSLSGRTAIAFGPWLALGGWITWLHGPILAVTMDTSLL